MTHLPILTRLIIALATLLLTACASTANVDYNTSYDFNSIRTIQLIDPDQQTSRDTRINSPLVSARIRDALTRQLMAKGFRMVESNADVSMQYQLTTRSGVESYGSGVSFGLGHIIGSHSGVGVGYNFPGYDIDSYDESVLTVDVLSMSDKSLLWRGSSNTRLDDGLTPEKLDKIAHKLVSETLANFPPVKQ